MSVVRERQGDTERERIKREADKQREMRERDRGIE